MAGVVVFGATGRMGQALIRLLSGEVRPESADELKLSGAACAPGSPACGLDAAVSGHPCGVLATGDVDVALTGAAVAVEFSRPQFVSEHAQACARAGIPLLVGTTGLDSTTRSDLEGLAHRIPVLIAPNTSIGVAVMARLVRQAALDLGPGFDVEIAEVHHRHKRDAPSGTALALGDVVAAVRGRTLDDVAVFDRHGTAESRAPGSIGFAVQRAGSVVGEHTVTFAADGEHLEIVHRATDRACFAEGALRAAAWLVGRPAGLYVMADVLGLA